ncbi:Olfactory Receptor 7A17 [Manis pentadactyla]|nr:Olfactory Receptor 7A17 [Manis pentadactyla]
MPHSFLLPLEHRAFVSIIYHPGRDSDFHKETVISKTPIQILGFVSIQSNYKEPGNDTWISGFLLLGLSEKPEQQPLLHGLFLSMHLITVFGNLLIILSLSSDYYLHTPMYFLLSRLSFVDICFTSTTISKILWNIQTQSNIITYASCITQMCFFIIFSGLDIHLLAVTPYDW